MFNPRAIQIWLIYPVFERFPDPRSPFGLQFDGVFANIRGNLCKTA